MGSTWDQKINRHTFFRQISAGSIVLTIGCGKTFGTIFGPSLNDLLAEGKINYPEQ